tara:strand:+ start:3353 stop:3556 length:204 start_codon:yes stop_codon:yes gene_type:complete
MTIEQLQAEDLKELEGLSRRWRDSELKETDWICAIPDHGLHASYMTYRQNLRDWPSTSEFPDTKPTL